MTAWLQMVGNSTLFYLSFDTHDILAEEVQIYYRIWKCGKNIIQISLCDISLYMLGKPKVNSI